MLYLYVTGEKKRGRGRLKRWEERWTWTANGASLALCLEKLLGMRSDCRHQRVCGCGGAVPMGEAGRI